MTFKDIRYSDHAALRIKQRKVTRADVRRIIARGERQKVATGRGASSVGSHAARSESATFASFSLNARGNSK
jgi:hypothetical protein